jgi:hypothetical protein
MVKMEKSKKAILLILEAIDLLQDIKFMYAKDNLNIAIKEIKKASIQHNKTKKISVESKNPSLSLKMVEKIILEEKNKLKNNK